MFIQSKIADEAFRGCLAGCAVHDLQTRSEKGGKGSRKNATEKVGKDGSISVVHFDSGFKEILHYKPQVRNSGGSALGVRCGGFLRLGWG